MSNGSGSRASPDPTKEPWHHEYYHLQSIVTGYNGDCLEIKKWSVTMAAGAAGFAYKDGVPELLYVASIGAFMFLLTEAYWRANQKVFIDRIRKIEGDLQHVLESPRISQSWLSDWGGETFRNDLKQVCSAMTRVRTLLPHAVIIVAAVILAAWLPPKPKPAGDANGQSSTSTPSVSPPVTPPKKP